jgi:hypothetical protein
MKVTPKQVETVLVLPAKKRFENFIKLVADWQEVWGLYQDGWALAADDNGVAVFPLWPAKEHAVACAKDEWEGFEPRAISLDDLMNALLPKLDVDKMLPGVFFTPTSRGMMPSIDEFREAIEAELENY